MITTNPIIQKLLSLKLPPEDFAVFGSGPMFAHGIKDLGHDADLVARGEAWKKVCQLGTPEEAGLGNKRVELFGGEIEIFDGWAPGEWSIDELIDTAEIIEGVRFITLANVVRWKKLMGREKDKKHLEMIETYLSANR